MTAHHLIRTAAAAVLVLGLAACGEEDVDPVTDDTALEEPEVVETEPSPTETEPAPTEGEETGPATPSPTGPGEVGEPIEIVETSFDLSLADMPDDEEPLTVTVPSPGTYTFRAINDADIVHALEVEGHGIEAETGDIPPGETATLEVTFEEAGEYDLYCPVANHKELGMDGSVEVQAG